LYISDPEEALMVVTLKVTAEFTIPVAGPVTVQLRAPDPPVVLTAREGQGSVRPAAFLTLALRVYEPAEPEGEVQIVGLDAVEEKVPPVADQVYDTTGPDVIAVYEPDPPIAIVVGPDNERQFMLAVVVTALDGHATTPPYASLTVTFKVYEPVLPEGEVQIVGLDAVEEKVPPVADQV
jgi:hypothetical protein